MHARTRTRARAHTQARTHTQVDGELRTQVSMDWLTESYVIELDKLPYYICEVEENIDAWIKVASQLMHACARVRACTHTNIPPVPPTARGRTHTHTHAPSPSIKVSTASNCAGKTSKNGANRAIHFDAVDPETTLATTRDHKPKTGHALKPKPKPTVVSPNPSPSPGLN